MNKTKHILITGLPGSGKTTLIKKLCAELTRANIRTSGFYTEELRDESNRRLGFDVVDLNGSRDKLARRSDQIKPFESTRCRVGQYIVFPAEFEKIAINCFKADEVDVLIIDEIGKMELFSDKFKLKVETAFNSGRNLIIATIPVAKTNNIPFIEAIRSNEGCQLITVDKNNRDALLEDIMKVILST